MTNTTDTDSSTAVTGSTSLSRKMGRACGRQYKTHSSAECASHVQCTLAHSNAICMLQAGGGRR